MYISLSLEQSDDDMYPFKEAKIVNFGNNLHRDWYVEFWVWHLQEKKMVRRRVKKGINRLHSFTARMEKGKKMVREINYLLKQGYVMGRENKLQKKDLKKSKFADTIEHILNLKKEEQLRPSTLKNYNQLLVNWNQFANHYGYGNLLTRQLSKDILDEFLKYVIHDKKLSIKSRNNMLSVLKMVIRYLNNLDNRIWRSNPIAFHKKLPAQSNKHAAYSNEQIALIKKEILNQNDDQLLLFIEFIYYCFTRPGTEARLIKIEHIQKDRLLIPAYNSKNRKGDYVSIPRVFVKRLNALQLYQYPQEYYLFSNSGKPGPIPVGKNYFYKRFKKILELTGLKNSDSRYDIYGFKHSGNINMYNSGIPLDIIQKQNRHQSIDQTNQYLRDLDLFRNSDAFDNVQSF